MYRALGEVGNVAREPGEPELAGRTAIQENGGGIYGTKWLDLNGNRVWDPNEPTLPGWTIILEAGNGITMSIVTDQFGNYSFLDLTTGVYTVTEMLQSGWEQTWPPTGAYSFLFAPDKIVEGLDFGSRPELPYGVHGTKWLDDNGNGQWDPSEPTLPGTTVIIEGSNGITMSTVTNQFGRYSFLDLTAGVYTITELLQSGWEQTWPPTGAYSLLLDPNQAIDGLDFGNRPELPDGVYGAKWFDMNGNGAWESYEPALTGWTIFLEAGNGITMSVVSDQFGRYSFLELPAGAYTITEISLTGWEQTWPADGSYNLFLDPGQAIEGLNFGNRPEATAGFHGAKWLDENGNGAWDLTELTLPGWTIILEDSSGITISTVTDHFGRYSFMDLTTGVYTITEFFRSGWEQSWPPVGTYSFFIDPSQAIDGLDFGNRPIPAGGIHGAKWLDENGNGLWDPSESGLPGWTIQLVGSGGISLTAVTNEDGHYWFMDLAAGVYTITEVLQPDWEQTFPDDGAHVVILDINQIIEALDFGNKSIPTGDGELHGIRWHDLDRDGFRDPFETDLPGWTIVLESEDGNTLSTVTDEFGRYWFIDLISGTYTITEVLIEGWHQSYPDNDLMGHNVFLESGQIIEFLDFGNYSDDDGRIYLPALFSGE